MNDYQPGCNGELPVADVKPMPRWRVTITREYEVEAHSYEGAKVEAFVQDAGVRNVATHVEAQVIP